MALFDSTQSHNPQSPEAINSLDLAIATGEPSGDWIAALAINSLLDQEKNNGRLLNIEGITGPHLQKCGVHEIENIKSLSVRGYVEVVKHLPRLLRLQKKLIRRWAFEHKPKVFMGVDAPDFNLKIELATRQSGVPTIHLVCPSIWAWRMSRIRTLKKACDHVLCLFPFEPKILSQAGIDATFIGHPMAHVIPQQIDMLLYRRKLAIDQKEEILAVLPGSRHSEIVHLAEPFINTCLALKREKPGLQFITPLPNEALLQKFLTLLPNTLRTSWKVQVGQSHESIGAANAVLLASGTATLEAMMFKKPMVIAYKMPKLSFHWMKRQATLPYIGLPNILLKQFAVPECIQDQANPENLKKHVLFQLDSESNRERLKTLFTEQHVLLRQPSGDLAAQIIRRYL